MKSNKKWIGAFVAFCILCAIIGIVHSSRAGNAAAAQISLDGEVIRVIDLTEVPEPYEFTVESAHGGINIIRVEQGRVAVTEADCPDQICVKQGYIDNSAVPIVCLPHRLSVTVTGGNSVGFDAVVGGK